MIRKINIFYLLFAICLFATTVLPQAILQGNDISLRRTASAFESAGQYENAADYYSRAVRINPKDVASYLGAKRCFEQLNNYDQFEQLILELQSKYRDLRFAVDLAWIEYKRGNEDKARQLWNTLISENAKQQETYSLIGQIYVENQMYNEAEALYLKGRSNVKNDLAFMYELSSIYIILNEQEKLINDYLDFVIVFPQQLDFLSNELQRFVQVQENITPLLRTLQKRLKSPDQPHWAIHYFLSDIYTMRQDYENALLHYIELERLLAENEISSQIRTYIKGKYLYDFANTALAANASVFAERAFMVIIEELGDSRYVTPAKLGLARVYSNQQQYEKALDALQLFVDENKRSADARLALMQMGDIAFFQLFDIARAEKAYQQALKEYPNVEFQVETLLRLAECATARDDLNAAENFLQRAQRLSVSNPVFNSACLMQLAMLEFYRMRPTASLSYLDDFDNVVYPSNQTNIYENDAIELSMLLREHQYDSTGLAQLGQAELLMKQRRFEESKKLLQDYLAEYSNSSLKSELRLRLVEAYKKLHDFQPAIQVLESVYSDSTSFYRDAALLSSAEIYENDLALPGLAQEQYEKILIEFPMSIHLETARERVRTLENRK